MARCSWPECGRWRPSLLARRRGLGVEMNGDWYCSPQCAGRRAEDEVGRASAREAVRTRALPRLKLGLLLVHQGAITPVQLREALAQQAQTGLKLGAQVVAAAMTDTHAVVKALAAQAGIPCLPLLDGSAARLCPELGANAVRALGVVPIGVDAVVRHVKVACAAPVPRLAIAALRELTGWTAEPFLVADRTLDALSEAYGALADQDARDQVVPREQAGAAIAEAAASSERATVSQAACDPYLWVRVSGADRPHDLFIPTGEETPWQAAHTSH